LSACWLFAGQLEYANDEICSAHCGSPGKQGFTTSPPSEAHYQLVVSGGEKTTTDTCMSASFKRNVNFTFKVIYNFPVHVFVYNIPEKR
jgi:hypothetical protein